MVNFTIGADPEVFVLKDKKPVSAHGLIRGTKENPFKVKYGAYQVDGMALEFNVDPTPLTEQASSTFSTKIARVVETMQAAARVNDPEYTFSLKSVEEFSKEVFDATPDEAKELGCNPDFNAYTGQMNPTPDSKDVMFRTGAGHIHLGWTEDAPVDHPEHILICRKAIKALDAYVGLFMTILDPEPRRRELYGKAGAFRPKTYGVEYRTPSNAWIGDDGTRRTIYELTYAATYFLRFGRTIDGVYLPREPSSLSEGKIERIINDGDWKRAYTVLKHMMSYVYTTYALGHIEDVYKKRVKAETPRAKKAKAVASISPSLSATSNDWNTANMPNTNRQVM